MNATLKNAVIRQLGGREDLEDIANHGADAGWSGFTYYTDTVAFFKRQRKNIVELVKEMADDFGQSPIAFVQSFNCLKGNDWEEDIARALYGRLHADDHIVPNALAWFALEEVARELTDN